MPFYIGDYLRDTSRLTTEGHGAYMLLIFDYWVSGQPLPDDDGQLAAITRLSVPKWKALRSTIGRFFQIADGVWRHKRIDEELAKATDSIGKRSAAGVTGAEARWGKRNGKRITNASETDSDSIPDANASSPSPSSSQVSNETRERGAPAPSSLSQVFVIDDALLAEAASEREKACLPKTNLYAERRKYQLAKPDKQSREGWLKWALDARALGHEAATEPQPETAGADPVTEFWEGFPDPKRVKYRDADWARRLYDWARDPGGYWAQQWGKRPDHPDCEAPKPMIQWAVAKAKKLIEDAA